MTNLTFYGGVGEVGGNKILLETKESRVFFDFGMSFKKAGLYFSEFLQPRKCNGIGDFLEFGLIPDFTEGTILGIWAGRKRKENMTGCF